MCISVFFFNIVYSLSLQVFVQKYKKDCVVFVWYTEDLGLKQKNETLMLFSAALYFFQHSISFLFTGDLGLVKMYSVYLNAQFWQHFVMLSCFKFGHKV